MQLLANPRILCVDDNRDACELLKFMLSFDYPHYQVSTICSAKESLILLASESFDLYILDFALPEISGVELCRKIRQTHSQTPILFFSAMAGEQDKKEAMEAGATKYLTKPDDLEILSETIAGLLKESLEYSQ